jgi:hypothetical protein
MNLLRKASSEPALPIREDYAEKYAKMMALKKSREEKERAIKLAEEKAKLVPAEEKPKVSLDRDDFFQGLIKKEEEEKKKNVNTRLIYNC